MIGNLRCSTPSRADGPRELALRFRSAVGVYVVTSAAEADVSGGVVGREKGVGCVNPDNMIGRECLNVEHG